MLSIGRFFQNKRNNMVKAHSFYKSAFNESDDNSLRMEALKLIWKLNNIDDFRYCLRKLQPESLSQVEYIKSLTKNAVEVILYERLKGNKWELFFENLNYKKFSNTGVFQLFTLKNTINAFIIIHLGGTKNTELSDNDQKTLIALRKFLLEEIQKYSFNYFLKELIEPEQYEREEQFIKSILPKLVSSDSVFDPTFMNLEVCQDKIKLIPSHLIFDNHLQSWELSYPPETYAAQTIFDIKEGNYLPVTLEFSDLDYEQWKKLINEESIKELSVSKNSSTTIFDVKHVQIIPIYTESSGLKGIIVMTYKNVPYFTDDDLRYLQALLISDIKVIQNTTQYKKKYEKNLRHTISNLAKP